MTRLGDVVPKVRSKNAGPFWLTIDVFCGNGAVYAEVVKRLETHEIARVFDVHPDQLKRFNIARLNVVKFSLPRPTVQGSVADRDMHGASWASLVADIDLSR